jgi:hemerythrin-like domain-containing protein
MQPTEVLSHEHRIIEQVLACLERMTQECTLHGRLDPQPAREAVDFFRTFADRCHHGKEEAHLFPAMEAAGSPRQCGPTAVMLREHELGRLRVREMATAIDAAASGQADALQRFVDSARAYVELLREHIEKEDHCLFPMANQLLTEKDQQDLTAAFGRVEAEEMGEGTHETYLKIANALAQQYGVPLTATVGPADHACGCGH